MVFFSISKKGFTKYCKYKTLICFPPSVDIVTGTAEDDSISLVCRAEVISGILVIFIIQDAEDTVVECAAITTV